MQENRLLNYLFNFKMLTAALVLFAVTGCNQDEETVAPIQSEPTLIEALEAFDEEIEYVEYVAEGESNARWGNKRWKRKPTFFTLVSALNYTGLLKTVVNEKLTIFAPDDRAFRKMGLNLWNVRKLDKSVLTDILLSHVVAGFVFSNELPDCSIETLNRSSIGLVPVNGGLVLQDDSKEATNLLFTDREALNSVFHGIDKVLDLEIPDATIAALANVAGFNELEKALLRASTEKIDLLAAVLDPESNLTVFAPDDDAFFALYDFLAGVFNVSTITIDDISPDILTLVLSHHVVGDRAFSYCLSQDQMITTLNDDEISVDLGNLSLISSGGITAELDASMLDIKAVNGVIHPIKSVLVPQNVLDQLPL
jgi:uncharacterized surface protein with fasciclin (FAS1) repeats